MESTDKIRSRHHRGGRSRRPALRRCDRGHAPDRRSIRSELEETRAEIKKGVIEHAGRGQGIDHGHPPRRQRADQCAEGALGDRRQIGPQIDVSDRAPSAPGAASARAAPAEPRAAGSRAAQQAGAARRPSPSGRTCREPQLRGTSTSSVRPSRPRAAPRQTASAPQSGWVRDLLRGASRDEEDGRAGAVADARRGPRRPALAAAGGGIAELAVGRHRPRDRPRRVDRAVGPLPARRARRLHPPPLHAEGPADLRRDPPQVPDRTANSAPPSTAIARISRSC